MVLQRRRERANQVGPVQIPGTFGQTDEHCHRAGSLVVQYTVEQNPNIEHMSSHLKRAKMSHYRSPGLKHLEYNVSAKQTIALQIRQRRNICNFKGEVLQHCRRPVCRATVSEPGLGTGASLP